MAYVDLDETLGAAMLRYDTVTRALPADTVEPLAGALIERLQLVEAATREAEACLLGPVPKGLSRHALHTSAIAHDDARAGLQEAVSAVQALIDAAASGTATPRGALRTG